MDPNKLDFYSFEYEWEIATDRLQNICKGPAADEIESPLFPSDSDQQWIIRIKRKAWVDDVYLEIIDDPPEFVWGKFSFSWNNIQIGCIYHSDNGTSAPKELDMYPIHDAILAHNASNVKIVCKASVVLESAIGVSFDAPTNKSLLKMSEDFERLYESKQNSDITFCVNDKEIKAHRAVLIPRSEVFAAMFENQLEEYQSGKISITDIDDEVLEEMLRYMYTGKVPKLDTMNVELLECSEKYQMADLKEHCLKSLKTQITIENAANTLMLADKYRSEGLKRHAIEYIIENAEDVTVTQAWKDMVTTHGHLIDETFRTIAVGSPAKKRKMN